ncbi:heavy-metal-associated domain-containing protein [Pseudomonas pohangensis]|nr:heavy metal-associated domain-containing protein [Pseudomonas pohangensis]
MQTIELNVQGMTCSSCVKHVNASLNQLAGVTSVEVDLTAGRVRVTGSVEAEPLITALDSVGYPAQLATSTASDIKDCDQC